MALTHEKIDELAGPADYFDRRVFARAIESEVRKQDTELIRQLVEALQASSAALWETKGDPETPVTDAVNAARARLEEKP